MQNYFSQLQQKGITITSLYLIIFLKISDRLICCKLITLNSQLVQEVLSNLNDTQIDYCIHNILENNYTYKMFDTLRLNNEDKLLINQLMDNNCSNSIEADLHNFITDTNGLNVFPN